MPKSDNLVDYYINIIIDGNLQKLKILLSKLRDKLIEENSTK